MFENVRETEGGVILPVLVIPNARKEEVVGWHEGRFKIKITAPPEKGKANLAVIRLLSKTFNIPQHRFILLRGQTSRSKDFLIENTTLPALFPNERS